MSTTSWVPPLPFVVSANERASYSSRDHETRLVTTGSGQIVYEVNPNHRGQESSQGLQYVCIQRQGNRRKCKQKLCNQLQTVALNCMCRRSIKWLHIMELITKLLPTYSCVLSLLAPLASLFKFYNHLAPYFDFMNVWKPICWTPK